MDRKRNIFGAMDDISIFLVINNNIYLGQTIL